MTGVVKSIGDTEDICSDKAFSWINYVAVNDETTMPSHLEKQTAFNIILR